MAALIGVSIMPTAGSDYSCKVPLDLLNEDGVPPGPGDKVSYSVDGTVQAVSGASATIKLDAINGQPLGSDSGMPPEGSPEEEASETPAQEAAEPPGQDVAEGETTADMGNRLRKKAKKNTLPLF